MRSAVENWIASADYDLKTAANLFKSRKYIYVVFFCHLAIEKVLKAIVCKRLNEMPPYTHNLNRLIELAGISVAENYLIRFLCPRQPQRVFRCRHSRSISLIYPKKYP